MAFVHSYFEEFPWVKRGSHRVFSTDSYFQWCISFPSPTQGVGEGSRGYVLPSRKGLAERRGKEGKNKCGQWWQGGKLPDTTTFLNNFPFRKVMCEPRGNPVLGQVHTIGVRQMCVRPCVLFLPTETNKSSSNFKSICTPFIHTFIHLETWFLLCSPCWPESSGLCPQPPEC